MAFWRRLPLLYWGDIDQGLKPDLLILKRILLCLSHPESPGVLEWWQKRRSTMARPLMVVWHYYFSPPDGDGTSTQPVNRVGITHGFKVLAGRPTEEENWWAYPTTSSERPWVVQGAALRKKTWLQEQPEGGAEVLPKWGGERSPPRASPEDTTMAERGGVAIWETFEDEKVPQVGVICISFLNGIWNQLTLSRPGPFIRGFKTPRP